VAHAAMLLPLWSTEQDHAPDFKVDQ
jgi:hypothetical protein